MSSITSLQNPKIKFLNLLKEKSRARKKEGLFIIEGKREIHLATTGGYKVLQLYYCPSIIKKNELEQTIEFIRNEFELFEITQEIYEKLAYRTSTEGVIGVAKTKDLTLNQLKLRPNSPLILVAEAPEKPGNIGALLRTADAANLDAVIIANPKTDLYNPNIVRSSVGCIFTNNVATGTTEEIINFLKAKNVRMYGAALQASVNYLTQDYTKSTAIIVGTEATGLSNQWLINTTKNIKIPMSGTIDSMNVSVAAGILIFEAKRQRGIAIKG